MSTQVIDQKVVEMRFDNENFEKNVSQSMSTIDKLKNALNFDGLKAFDGLGKAADNINLSGISNAVDEASSKFSVLEIAGITAIAKISSAAMDMGVSLVKSLSLDQISTGFNKYAEKTTAIQTIISATGESMEEVTRQVEKLNWFTDETSYNLTDMISNIGKFTNAGISLQDAVPQMMGIAAAAGEAGKGVQGASHAMEGFSKAMATGYMSKQNWKWIETSGINTVRFSKAMIEAGEQCGQLTKIADNMWQTLEGNEVTAETIANNLKDKWMTAEVMQQGLAQFGDFSYQLAQVMEDLDYSVTTSRFLEMIDEYKEGTLDLDEAAEECEISVSELKETLDFLSSDDMSLGNHALKMAQEAKTFAEAIDSVKDAVSTGWMTTLEYIFGNYEEAKKLWTALANDLYDVFAEPGNKRNEILGFWNEMGGRVELIHGLVEAVNLLVRPLSMVKQAFESLFPDTEGMANILYNLTVRFHEFVLELQPSEETMNDIYWIFKGVFSVIKTGLTLIGRLVKLIVPIYKPIGGLLTIIVKILGYIGKFLTVVSELISRIRILPGVATAISAAFGGFLDILKNIGLVIGSGLVTGITILVNIFATLIAKVVEFIQTTHPLQTALSFIAGLIKMILPIILRIGAVLGALVVGPIALAVTGIVALGKAIKDFIISARPLEQLGNFLSSAFTTIGTGLSSVVEKITGGFGGVSEKLSGTSQSIEGKVSGIAKKAQTLGQIISATFDGVVSSIRGGNVTQAFKYISDGASAAITRVKDVIGTLTGIKKPVEAVNASLKNSKQAVLGARREVTKANGQVEVATTYARKMEDNLAGANVVIAESGTLTRNTTEEVNKSTTVWEKLINILKGFGTIAVGAGLVVVKAFTSIVTKIKNLFVTIGNYIKDFVSGNKSLGQIFTEIFGGLIEKIKFVADTLKEMLAFFGVDVEQMAGNFGRLAANLKSFFSTIDSGKVAALIFAAAMVGIAGALISLSDSFKSVMSGISSFFGNINKILKKQFLKSTPLKDMAEAFALLAASLALLTLVNQDDLKNVAHIMGQFVIAGMAMTAFLTIMAAKFSDENLAKGFETTGKILIGLAGSILVMASALWVLSKVDLVGNKTMMEAVIDWAAKLGLVFVMMAEMAVMARVFSKLAPKMALNFVSIAALSVAFLTIALSLKALGEIQFKNVQDNLWQLGVVLAAFGVLIAGMGKLKVTSFLSVLFIAKAIEILWPKLVKVYEILCGDAIDPLLDKVDAHQKLAYGISAMLATLGVALWGLGQVSKLFISVGVAASGLALGVAILMAAVKNLAEILKGMDKETSARITGVLTSFMITMGVVFGLISAVDSIIQAVTHIKAGKDNKFKVARQNFITMGIGMVALAGAMYIIIGAFKKLEEVTRGVSVARVIFILTIFNSLMFFYAAAIAAVGYAARGKGSILIVAAMCASLGIIFAALAILAKMVKEDPENTIKAFVGIMAVLAAFAVIMKFIGGIKTEAPGKVINKITIAIATLITLAGAISVLIYKDYTNEESLYTAVKFFGLMGVVLLALTALFRVINFIPAQNNRIDDTMQILSGIVIAMVAFAGSVVALGLLGSNGAFERMIQAAAMIGIFVTLITVLTLAITGIAKMKVEDGRITQTLDILKDIIFGMIAFAASIALLGAIGKEGGMARMTQAAALLGAFMLVLTALTWWLTGIAKMDVKSDRVAQTLVTMKQIVGAMIMFGIEVALLSKLCDEKEMAIAGGIITGMTLLTVIFTEWLNGIGKRTADTANVKKVMLMYYSIVGTMIALGIELGVLAHSVNMTNMTHAAKIISGMAIVSLALTTILSLITHIKVDKNDMVNTLIMYGSVVGAMVVFGIELGILARKCKPDALKMAALCLGGLTAAVTVLTGVLLLIAKLSKQLTLRDMTPMLVALGSITVVTIVLANQLCKLAQYEPDSIKMAGLVLGGLLAAVEALSAVLVFISKLSDKFLNWGGLVATIVSMIAACLEISILADAIKKIAMHDPASLSKAAEVLTQLIIVVGLVAVVTELVSGLVGTTGPFGLGGLAIGVAALLVACLLVYEAGEAAAKAGVAFKSFAEDVAVLATIDLNTIAAGVQVLADTSDDLRKLAGALKNLGPEIETLERLASATNSMGKATGSGSGLSEYVKDINETSNGVEKMTTVIKEDEKEWAELTREVQSGTLTTQDNITTTTEKIADQKDTISLWGDSVSGFFDGVADSAKTAWGQITSFWSNGGVDKLRQDTGTTTEDWNAFKFGVEHPIIKSITDSFSDPSVISYVSDSIGLPFGENFGGSIVEGIISKLNEALPGVISVLNSVFGGFLSFDASALSSLKLGKGWTEDMLPGADKVNKEATIPMKNYSDALSGAATAMSEANKNAAAFGRTQADLNSKTALTGDSAFRTAGAFDILKDKVGLNEKVTSTMAKAEDYASETIDKVKESAKEATEGLGGLGNAAESAGGKASKASKGFKNFADSLKSTIEGQLDMFSKFEIKTDVTSQSIIENMKSNIDGFASWSHRMTVIAEKFAAHGIDESLYEKIAGLGPNGYATMNAFYEMTEEQLDQVKELWKTGMTLPEGQADIVASGFQYMGEMSIQGFSNALNNHKQLHAAVHGIKQTVDTDLREDFLIQSPSRYMFEMGAYLIKGLIEGMTDPSMMERLRANIVNVVCFRIKDTFNTELSPESFEEYGRSVLEGLITGLSDETLLTKLDEVTSELGTMMERILSKKLEINSPSHVFQRIGHSVGEGLTLGIKESANNVLTAVESIGDDTIKESDSILDTISSFAGDNMSIVITPILDLSYLHAQMAEVNSMFGEKEIGTAEFGQNEGTSTVPTQINYTQNNYSPKSLSRIDIYRQTRNQLSMFNPKAAMN